ncbi:MAG: cell division protein ZapA [Candidatus Marinimicrobia bacterium]|nr:cell division protein ZapA [Candidatus Neomarinimicrobiota bacterium]
MSQLDNNIVEVTIFGKKYKIRAQADSDYIVNVAKYVDEKMQQVEQSLDKKQSEIRIAILAAMNITDELFNCQSANKDTINTIKDKTDTLIKSIDENIEEIE